MNLKSVAYIRDVLQIRKLSFWVCLKTRRVTKRDALELATLRYCRRALKSRGKSLTFRSLDLLNSIHIIIIDSE